MEGDLAAEDSNLQLPIPIVVAATFPKARAIGGPLAVHFASMGL
jgi:hypothetical protein